MNLSQLNRLHGTKKLKKWKTENLAFSTTSQSFEDSFGTKSGTAVHLAT